MKNHNLSWLVFCILALAACNFQKKHQPFQLGNAFMLKYGETAQLETDETVQIRFDSILDDSRCPQGVQCVWAGRAIVAITFFQQGQSQSSALVMGDPGGTNYSKEAVFGDFTVTLFQVRPHPIAEQTIEQKQYFVQLVIVKKE